MDCHWLLSQGGIVSVTETEQNISLPVSYANSRLLSLVTATGAISSYRANVRIGASAGDNKVTLRIVSSGAGQMNFWLSLGH